MEAENKVTFSGENYAQGNTAKGIEILRYILKILTIAIPIFGGRVGLSPEEMGGCATIAIGATEGLKMFGK